MKPLHSGTADENLPASNRDTTPMTPRLPAGQGMTPITRVASSHQATFTAAMKGHTHWPLPHIPPFTGE